MLLKLGFSGGIASGKTARCNHLVSTLAPKRFSRVKLLSADHIGHQTYLPGTSIYHKLIERFGRSIVSSSAPSHTTDNPLPPINRKVLGQLVFGDVAARKDLNAIIWPAIKAKIGEEIETFETKVRQKKIQGQLQQTEEPSILICEAALLTEMDIATFFDEVWLLGCDEEEAVRRVMKRDELEESLAKARVAAQLTLSERQRLLERDGFITVSSTADPSRNLKQEDSHSAKKVLRVFDTTKHATLADGLMEIDGAFSAMTSHWRL